MTPGVLRALVPLLQKITAISLGLSYSITDDDLFDFLGQLESLESAQLQHYLVGFPFCVSFMLLNLVFSNTSHRLLRVKWAI